MTINLRSEVEAHKALVDLLERAEKVRLLFEQAQVPLPDALQRLLRSGNHPPSAQAVASFRPSAPPEAEQDWVWIEQESATPGTLALAVLRASGAPLTVREVHEKVCGLGVEVSVGTIANVGTRADENGLITRGEDGHWQLAQREKAAVIHEGFVWGIPEAFQMYELASYRRGVILNLLRQTPVGLQQAQILAQLKQSEFMRPKIPASKGLVKADLEAMEGKKVRRRGNSRKWEAI
jgi:hypothetical protein